MTVPVFPLSAVVALTTAALVAGCQAMDPAGSTATAGGTTTAGSAPHHDPVVLTKPLDAYRATRMFTGLSPAEVRRGVGSMLVRNGYALYRRVDGIDIYARTATEPAILKAYSCEGCLPPQARVDLQTTPLENGVQVMLEPYWYQDPGSRQGKRVNDAAAVTPVARKLQIALDQLYVLSPPPDAPRDPTEQSDGEGLTIVETLPQSGSTAPPDPAKKKKVPQPPRTQGDA